MKYKFLAFDLDGTLTNSDKKITARTKEALYKAREAGAHLILASGRPTYGIMPLANELEFAKYGDYILSYNGGAIINCKTMETIYEQKVPTDLVKPLCQYAIKKNYAILTYEGESVITNNAANKHVQHEAFINNLPVRQVDNIDEHITFPVNKFLITEDPEIVSAELPIIKEEFPGLNIFTSAPYFMEIVPPGIDKAVSLSNLLKIFNCTMDELASFGDGGNDVTMLKAAGLGVAMSNAPQFVRDAADYVTCSNDEDGCAVAIEKMLVGTL